MRIRGAALDGGWLRTWRLDVPVISVGNIVAGGTGKSPAAYLVAGLLQAMGLRPAIVSRGHGGVRPRDPMVAGLGHGPSAPAALVGDEPAMMARRGGGIVVAVGRHRAQAGALAVGLGCNVLVLDDGFQHRRLARDLDVVMVDRQAPLGNGRILPAGPLREPLSALRRADLLWYHGSAPGKEGSLDPRPFVASHYRPGPLRWLKGNEADLQGRPVLLLAAIARPAAFRALAEEAGLEVVGGHYFRDHHPFEARELQAVAREARDRGAVVVTTEKDAARLGEGAGEMAVLEAEMVVEQGMDLLLSSLRRAVERWCTPSCAS